ncbi:hypothetical protein K438DRAFT_2019047 [Mycena galopus ATCC 62051]|nr:hypothetical protein K438DRAFT_2019047 [Mycena galopus ATCC 62051]
MIAARKKLTKDQKARRDQQIREIPVGEQFTYQSTGAAGVSERIVKTQASTATAPLPLQPAARAESVPPPSNVGNGKSTATPRETHNAKVIRDFEDHHARLGAAMLSHEHDPNMGKPCRCGVGVCEAICFECCQYPASCRQCFIKDHRHQYFHWVNLWVEERGCYVRHDMSMIAPPLQMGHHAERCGAVNESVDPIPVIIIDTNGVHRTKVYFCAHTTESRVDAFMKARMFPATFLQPETAYTFEVMKQFQIFHLESKISAYDYCGSLMRLTDNAFTDFTVSDIFDSFVRAARLWGVLITEKRMGQMHGIDDVLTHRPEGNVVLYCPACPEPGFNMDPKLPHKLPLNLQHLNQEKTTLDGNFHCNKAKKSDKNNDPNDTSLYHGKAHFPEREAQREYLRNSLKDQEKSTCNYLKAVNNQDKKKFKNMEVTGVVNSQCSHVFVKATVDLEMGERFVNVDAALAQGIYQKIARAPLTDLSIEFQLETSSVDRVVSYDIACQYSVNLKKRFEHSFPDLLPIIERLRWTIPALHVQGHHAVCMYAYAAAYKLATGHFHGETAEQYWPELNQIGPKVRQMNYGHRQDTIINHHNDWNHKKMIKMVAALEADLNDGQVQFEAFKRHFLSLCTDMQARIETEKWFERSRETKRISPKEVTSVYMYDPTLKGKLTLWWVPTQLAIYTQMLAEEQAVDTEPSLLSKAAVILNEGLLIQAVQTTIAELVKVQEEHPLRAKQTEIENRRAKIVTRINKWRIEQTALMPLLADRLANRAACEVEKENLFLPSDFDAVDRAKFELTPFEATEAKLREGAAYDALKKVQVVAKNLVALTDRKKKNVSGQQQHTKALEQIQDAEARRDRHIKNYMRAREALMKLGWCTGAMDDFPELTVADTWMKSRRQERALGSSRAIDGWATAGVTAGTTTGTRLVASSSSMPPAGTVMPERKKTGKRTAKEPGAGGPAKKQRTMKPPRKAGWLWTMGKMGKMSEAEMKAWSAEGDRVQWFRAEADMVRWQEFVEQKLAEFRTTIRSFKAYKLAWSEMAVRHSDQGKIGHVAYAKKKAQMWAAREEQARLTLRKYPRYAFLEEDDAELLPFVEAERDAHAASVASALSSGSATHQHDTDGSGDDETSGSEDD